MESLKKVVLWWESYGRRVFAALIILIILGTLALAIANGGGMIVLLFLCVFGTVMLSAGLWLWIENTWERLKRWAKT